MRTLRCFGVALLPLIAISPVVRAAEPDPTKLAARIDKRIAALWAKQQVHPAAPTDDATFLRRVRLDLTGTIPTAAEVRAFLDDKDDHKREKRIDQLLASPGYVRHAATVWRARWLQQADQPQNAALVPGLEAWLQQRLRDNTPYDQLVAEMLTGTTRRPAAGTPAAFLQAIERTPEGQAGVTARLFLGLNVDCAQCHNHPFARWTREQFWEYAAFFAPVMPSGDGPLLTLAIPGTEKKVSPRFLNGDAAKLPARLEVAGGRTVLATWMIAPENAFFAVNAVNRIWAELFGVGLIEPLDDLSGQVAASHPELLDDLATAFRDSRFDLKFLLKALLLSKTYQLASTLPERQTETDDARLFARMQPRLLNGEQLHDSLRLATGLPDRPNARATFLAQFGRLERPSEAQRSILQALQLMNGKLVEEATWLTESGTLTAVAEAPYLDDGGRVDALFLATLSRFPTPRERERFTAYVKMGGPHKDARKALADLFWALLNSNEFGTNH